MEMAIACIRSSERDERRVSDVVGVARDRVSRPDWTSGRVR